MIDEATLRRNTDGVMSDLHAMEGIVFDARSAIDLAYFAAIRKKDPESAKRAVTVALRELDCLGSALMDARDRCRSLHALLVDEMRERA